jgi:hypothetical protein
MKFLNALWRQNVELLIIKAGGKYVYHREFLNSVPRYVASSPCGRRKLSGNECSCERSE